MDNLRDERVERILRGHVVEYGLDLGGLTVMTEAATGHYLHTPLLAALAGARKVYAVTADSRYGTREEVGGLTAEAARRLGVAGRVEVLFGKSREAVGESDVITNSGFVRPITREVVSWMKPTAVVPLMWETWEFRDADLDLRACRERGVLVLGTDESRPPLSMYPYSGFAAMKLLFELGLEGYRTKTILLGGGTGLGRSIRDHFGRLGMEVAWFADSEEGAAPYSELGAFFSARGADYDALVVAEHGDDTRLLGSGGALTYEQIVRSNPGLRVGVMSGNVDIEGLRASGLRHFPAALRPFRYMSYHPGDLGPLPVLDLYAAGLKVGEAMARARLGGMGLEEAKRYALANSPAMDFPGEA
ncbi:MAG TPA: hypothetical protein VF736_22405 [Pyrinomonadaceae bacterium]|jgi:hypothetical protein